MRGQVVFVPVLVLAMLSCTPVSPPAEASPPPAEAPPPDDSAPPDQPPSPGLPRTPDPLCVVDGDGNPVVGATVVTYAKSFGPPGSVYGWESAQTSRDDCGEATTGADGCAAVPRCGLLSLVKGDGSRPLGNAVEVVVGDKSHNCSSPRRNQVLRVRADGPCQTLPP